LRRIIRSAPMWPRSPRSQWITASIRVHKVTCVLDCGQAVNPDIVRAQMEGGVIYGLTAALYGGLNLDRGAIKESNFHDYPMLRMDESPEIEVDYYR
jgi:isoquinoline 1-oxidoreductase beta subunit